MRRPFFRISFEDTNFFRIFSGLYTSGLQPEVHIPLEIRENILRGM
jgi:hypothetical protein